MMFEEKFKIDKLYNPKSNVFNPGTLRIALVFGILIYGVFGVLDYYMMPVNYKVAWLVRFGVITPLLILTFILSYKKWLLKYSKLILFVLLTLGQLGILFFIWISDINELAYLHYYAGLILVILWANFIFNLKFSISLYIAVSTVLFYNLVVIIKQSDLLVLNTDEFYVYLGNNFFLISSAILTLIGNYKLDKQESVLEEANIQLEKEKKELKFAKIKAEESSQLKSAFLANLSHEIRTPLNGILGLSNLLSYKNLANEDRDKYIKSIKENSDRLLNQINDLVELSKIESGIINLKYSSLSVDTLFNTLYQKFASNAKNKNLDFEFFIPAESENLIINTDIIKLESVFERLLSNAFKYTNSGSVTFGVKENNKKLRFYVKDTGIGIPDDRQKAIFESFVQADIKDKMAKEGIGIGLSICQAYLNKMNSELEVESKVDEGSCFFFKFDKKAGDLN